MHSPLRSQRAKDPKADKHLFRHWVTCAKDDGVEVQRLSRMALKERRKHAHRWRVVSGGLVVALYDTREELDVALENSKRNGSRDLLQQLDAPLDSPRMRSSASNSLETPRTPPISSAPSSTPERTSPKSTSLPSKEDYEEDPNLAIEIPQTPENLANDIMSKAMMDSDKRVARRHDLVKPAKAAQLPTGPQKQVLGWFYDEDTTTWTCRDLLVRIAEEPFAEGAMRLAFKMLLKDGDVELEYVAKKFGPVTERDIIAVKPEQAGSSADMILERSAILHNVQRQKNPTFLVMFAERVLRPDCTMTGLEFRRWYKRLFFYQGDIEMQGFCQTYAKAFNQRRPPKRVVFLDAFLIVCHDEPDQPIYACEPMIQGDFEKYNNNAGEVKDRAHERNTPQAFSHFTYLHSNKRNIIVDIQGVGDTYTDPQVHSLDRHFGLGNLKQEGIDAFFKSHRCNNICKGLGLVEKAKINDALGTMCPTSHADPLRLPGDPKLPGP